MAAADEGGGGERLRPLPPEELISDLADAETAAADSIDDADHRRQDRRSHALDP